MKFNIISIFAWYGALAILIAFFLVSYSYLSPHTITYQVLNGTGALGLGIESFHKHDYQPSFLNVVWFIIALISLIKLVA